MQGTLDKVTAFYSAAKDWIAKNPGKALWAALALVGLALVF